MSTPNKTQPTADSVDDFLLKIEDDQKRVDSRILVDLMTKFTNQKPVLWGSIIGFGSYHYKYASGKEDDFLRIGFSPRKDALTIHIISGFEDLADKLGKLGKHKIGKSCLYIKRLSDVNMVVLEEIIQFSLGSMDQKYPKK